MHRSSFLFTAILTLLSTLSIAQTSLLQSGPMVGYSEMLEVMLWVQTTAPADVQISYWPKDQPEDKKLTNLVKTVAARGFTAHLLANQVEPGTNYQYEVLINGKAVRRPYPTEFVTQKLWQWREDPPAFSMALGSCTYVNEPEVDRPGEPYGGDYQIFQSIHQKDPDLMLWLGDNIYLREVDWYSTTGIYHRYTHTRSLPEMQALLASTHNYAIWDDHDFGPNDSNRSYIHKEKTWLAFQDFWANPSYGLPGQKGTTTMFQWADVDFFLLDDRYFRSPNGRESGEGTLLGTVQLEWLIDALSSSNASFKFVAIGGQVLNTAAVYENYANRHAKERAYLLQRLNQEGIKNVIFLTGDRHHTELSKLTTRDGVTLFDFTVSPLTSSAARPLTETNGNRVENTLVTQRNFGWIQVEGPRAKRMLTLTVFDSNGEALWSEVIQQE
ncbi:MAG: alkaline phosphatase family protein [Phaeodactylibacter sp.]|nr:alkaline phosphatase family protein [Phaeodactylibacter sp.]